MLRGLVDQCWDETACAGAGGVEVLSCMRLVRCRIGLGHDLFLYIRGRRCCDIALVISLIIWIFRGSISKEVLLRCIVVILEVLVSPRGVRQQKMQVGHLDSIGENTKVMS